MVKEKIIIRALRWAGPTKNRNNFVWCLMGLKREQNRTLLLGLGLLGKWDWAKRILGLDKVMAEFGVRVFYITFVVLFKIKNYSKKWTVLILFLLEKNWVFITIRKKAKLREKHYKEGLSMKAHQNLSKNIFEIKKLFMSEIFWCLVRGSILAHMWHVHLLLLCVPFYIARLRGN